MAAAGLRFGFAGVGGFADGLVQGPCQKFARNCATRNRKPPHDPTLHSISHLGGCVGTWGATGRRKPPAHRSMVRMRSGSRLCVQVSGHDAAVTRSTTVAGRQLSVQDACRPKGLDDRAMAPWLQSKSRDSLGHTSVSFTPGPLWPPVPRVGCRPLRPAGRHLLGRSAPPGRRCRRARVTGLAAALYVQVELAAQ